MGKKFIIVIFFVHNMLIPNGYGIYVATYLQYMNINIHGGYGPYKLYNIACHVCSYIEGIIAGTSSLFAHAYATPVIR